MTRRVFNALIVGLMATFGVAPRVSATDDPDNCPACGKAIHFCCHNRDCSCWRDLEPGERPLQDTAIDDVLACAYCGHAMHIDWWFDRSMASAAASPDRKDP